MILGGIDFAIIEDRKFKSGPKGKIPQQGPRPDHIRNQDYDPKSIDLESERKNLNWNQTFGFEMDPDSVKATMVNGILDLTIEKKEKTMGK